MEKKIESHLTQSLDGIVKMINDLNKNKTQIEQMIKQNVKKRNSDVASIKPLSAFQVKTKCASNSQTNVGKKQNTRVE